MQGGLVTIHLLILPKIFKVIEGFKQFLGSTLIKTRIKCLLNMIG